MFAARSRRGRSTRRGQASREQILQAATELLVERGYSRLSIASVCDRADISPTSVYWHFGSKAGLMEAVIDRIGAGTVEKIRASVAKAKGTPEKLDRLISGLRELILTRPFGSLTGVAILGEGRHVTEELAAALRVARRREIETIAADIEAEIGRPVPYAHCLAVVATACANYAALTYQIEQNEAEVDRVLEALRDAIVRIAGPDLGIAGPDLGIAGPDLGIAGPDLGSAGPDLGIAGPRRRSRPTRSR